MTAELEAISEAIKHVANNHRADKKVAIFTDSLSSVQSIENPVKSARNDIIQTILDENKKAVINGTEITIIWIPSHVGIVGNDEADNLANIGRKDSEEIKDIKLGVKEMKSLIKQKVRDTLMQAKWNNAPNSLLKRLNPKLGRKLPYGEKHRLITAMRLETAQFHTLRHSNELYCRKCRALLTIQHTMIVCTHFEKERKEIRDELEKENKMLTLENILSFDRPKPVTKLVDQLLTRINELFTI